MGFNNNDALNKADAMDKIFEHSRDYLSAKFKLPLGDPVLKNVHTNQYMFTELPEEFALANWGTIANALSSSYNRFSGATYVTNRWYNEAITIDVDADSCKGEMTIDVNALASSTAKYSKDYREFEKSYNDAVNDNSTSKTTSATKKTTNAVASTNSSVKGGEGKTIDNLVKKIVGNETDDLKKAKLIHGWLQKEVRYGSYSCSKYSSAESAYKHRKYINCADTARLTRAMMSSAGLDAWVVHRYSNNGHFWTLIKINGKIYASDQTGNGSAFNTIWYSDGDRRTCNSRGGNWEYNRGKNPSC